ncbi:calmodulin-A-like [Bolinopsis microptera]|uniref:calmodulin-A-like n=1 Tax=Bolinopsis microptera TaxID=2820187 RepID=UPI003079D506
MKQMYTIWQTRSNSKTYQRKKGFHQKPIINIAHVAKRADFQSFYKRKNGKPTPITLSVEQVEEYECAFKQFDINGDGVITTVELGAMLRSIGLNPSHKEIQEMIAEVDCNGDGIIDFCEFLKMMSRHSNPGVDPEQQLAEVFRLFDKDRSGYITQDELRSVMLSLGQPLSDEQLRDMIAYADLDGDGKINLKEFIKIMTTDTKCR